MIFKEWRDHYPDTAKRLKMSFIEGFYSVGTATTSLAVLWWFLPFWLAVSLVSIVIVHELGHYFTATALGEHVNMPFFLPIFYFVVGGTHVRGDNPVSGIKIASAGPIAGSVWAAVIAIAALIVGFMPAVWAALWLGLFQTYSGTLGSDGRKRRRFKRAIDEFKAGAASASVPA